MASSRTIRLSAARSPASAATPPARSGSICFDRQEPIVDGNVARVLSRVHGIAHPLGSKASETALWTEAGALVKGERPGDLNQGLMELGARVCTPKSPLCDTCPIHRFCVARRSGRVDALPVPKKRKAPKRVEVVAVVATNARRVALVRTEGSLFKGLYGPPMVEGRGRDRAREALKAARVTGRLGREPAGGLEHVLSHRVLDVEIRRAGAARGERARLVEPAELPSLGVSTLTRRILDAAR